MCMIGISIRNLGIIMISASEAVMAINKHRGDALVVGTMTPNRYWELVSDNPQLDLPIFGAMGKASSVALGLALACPDKKVLVLDGDGGLLMNLGSLVTIAGQQPSNLVHFVFEDGVYLTTGGQPIPGADSIDFAGIANNAGLKMTYVFDDLEEFVSELPVIMEQSGPTFVCLKVHHTGDVPAGYIGSTKDAARRVMKKLKTDRIN